MKKMKKIKSIVFIIIIIIISTSCSKKIDITSAPSDPNENKWVKIQELGDIDVNYLLKYKNTLFLAACDPQTNYSGIIYTTKDGINWTKFKEFENPIGPLALNGDTLYCLCRDSLYRYSFRSALWEGVCVPFPLNADVTSVSEMIFLDNSLYAMQTYFSATVQTYKIFMDGRIEELKVREDRINFGGAKFLKRNNTDNWCYVRGQYFNCGFYIFDGIKFHQLRDGLSDKEWVNPPTQSICIKEDTLFAGFKYPAHIKYLDNNTWKTYTDTLRQNIVIKYLNSQIKTETTDIAFVNNRMFVATNCDGVLEWKGGEGWVQISDGLVSTEISEYLYVPITFLTSVQNVLIASYGKPGFAPWGGVGVYRYIIK